MRTLYFLRNSFLFIFVFFISVFSFAQSACNSPITGSTGTQSVSAADCLALSDATSCIQQKIEALQKLPGSFDYCGGGEVYFPRGIYSISGSLKMRNDVYLRGEGIDATIIKYSGNVAAIDGRGVKSIPNPYPVGPIGSPNDGSDKMANLDGRVMFRISDMTIDGARGGAAADGLLLAYNFRSGPILSRVKVQYFQRNGIRFTGPEWNISFENVEISANAHNSSYNASGVINDPSVTDFNAVYFNGGYIENNGSASSTSGGVFLNNASTMRGVVFDKVVFEQNYGTDQVLIMNVPSVVFNNVYFEVGDKDDGAEACIGLELYRSVGTVLNSTFAAGSRNCAKVGIKKSASGTFILSGNQYMGNFSSTELNQ